MDNQTIPINARWAPQPDELGNVNILLPLTHEPELWFRIYPGPRSVPLNEFEEGIEGMMPLGQPSPDLRIIPPGGRVPAEGYRYFRNPAQ
jgi:hypothetical protein